MRLMTLRTESGTVAAIADGSNALIIPGDDGKAAYSDAGAVLRAGSTGRHLVQRAFAHGEPLPYTDQQVGPPVLRPDAVFCVGLNFAAHIREMGQPLPTSPTYFSKLARALTGPFDRVELTEEAFARLDYEGELAVVVGRAGRNVSPAAAWQHVGGYAVMNDVTMRDRQRRSSQWFAGKNWQHATPLGPWIVTPEDVGDVDDLELVTRVNGEERQRSALSDLVFDIPTLISDLSTMVELEPGDVIATGTPAGVGDGREPRTYLRPGDQVEVEVGRVGSVRTTFVTTEGRGRP